MKTYVFQSCGHCWIFQICWHIECNTFTTSSFRIWNSSGGIPSPPLALFIVMIPKAPLTLHSRMSGSRWVITPLWLSGSLRSFLYSSSVYSCHLFLISSDFPCGSAGKESACNVEDLGSIPRLRRSPGEGNSYPLQYSGLVNSMVCTVYAVAKSQIRLSDFHFHFNMIIENSLYIFR